MLNNDSGNPYFVSDLNISLLGIMFAVVSGRDYISKDLKKFFFLHFFHLLNLFKNEILDLNNTKEQLDLTDIQNTPPNGRIYTVFSSARRFSRIDHMLGH